MVVDLPDPLGPRKPWTSPVTTWRSRPSRARGRPERLHQSLDLDGVAHKNAHGTEHSPSIEPLFTIVVPGSSQPTLGGLRRSAAYRLRRHRGIHRGDRHVRVQRSADPRLRRDARRSAPATTHWAYADILENLGAKYRHQRWVEDGKYLTTAGVSAGIDGGLYLAQARWRIGWILRTSPPAEISTQSPTICHLRSPPAPVDACALTRTFACPRKDSNLRTRFRKWFATVSLVLLKFCLACSAPVLVSLGHVGRYRLPWLGWTNGWTTPATR